MESQQPVRLRTPGGARGGSAARPGEGGGPCGGTLSFPEQKEMSKQLSGDIVTSKGETSLRHGGREGMARTRLLRLTREAQDAGAAGGAGLSAPVSGARALATRGASRTRRLAGFPRAGPEVSALRLGSHGVRRSPLPARGLVTVLFIHHPWVIPDPPTRNKPRLLGVPYHTSSSICDILQYTTVT